MNGTIHFDDIKQLAEFLLNFSGSTAIFNVFPRSNGRWDLIFAGGF